MFFESFFQDLRIGLRMLVKDKTFFILAVTVLALGICGVTTQFTMVNAIMLRGFSFPHPEQLMNVGLIDPQATDQNNNFGNGNIPSSQDYEDLRAGQKSFALMSALSQRLDDQRDLQENSPALHRRLCDGGLLQDHRRETDSRSRFYGGG